MIPDDEPLATEPTAGDGAAGSAAAIPGEDGAAPQDRIAALEATVEALTNLLTSTKIAVLLLDSDLVIRRFTPAMRDTMHLLDSDIGRPIEDVAMRASDPALVNSARACLRTLNESEAEVETDTGQVLIRRLRPYRAGGSRIDGLVVTYTDITSLHQARTRARSRERQQQAMSELGREALSGAPPESLFAKAAESVARHLNSRFVKIVQIDEGGDTLTLRGATGWGPDAVVGSTQIEGGAGSQAGYTLLRSTPVVVEDFRTETRFAPPRFLSRHNIRAGASVIIGPVSAPWGVLGAHETEIGRCAFSQDDLNFLQGMANVLWLAIRGDKAARDLERERAQLRALTDALPIRFAVIGRDERYEFVNRAYETPTLNRDAIEGMSVRELLGDEAYAIAGPRVRKTLEGEPQDFELTVTGGETGTRHALVRYVPRVEGGAITGMYSAVVDITSQRLAERESLERLEHYRAVGDTIPFGVWTADTRGRMLYLSRSFLDMTGLTADQAAGLGWLGAVQEETRASTRDDWIACLAAGDPWEREQRFVDQDGKVRHVLAIGRPVHGADGAVVSWAGFNLDITNRKDREERMAMISAELDHRVKNILAIVATIARMTARNSATIDDYRRSLDHRLQAMANAHQVLADSGWRGMGLKELLTRELSPYLAADSAKVTLSGPDVQLQPGPTQTLALAFHELTTNAAKYGALSHEGGHLAVTWNWEDHGVRLTWTETGVPDVRSPEASGFGTALLERVLTAQFDSSVETSFEPDGIRVAMALPMALLRP